MGAFIYHFMAIASISYLTAVGATRRLEDKAAWEEYCQTYTGSAQEKNAWMAALAYERKRQRGNEAELLKLRRIVGEADELLRVSVGLHKAQRLMGEKDVPDMVRCSILVHWFGEWNAMFGVKEDGKILALLYDWLLQDLQRFRAHHENQAPVAAFKTPSEERQAALAEIRARLSSAGKPL